MKKLENIKIKDILLIALAMIILGFGVSLMMKANIGLSAWDALSATLANLFGIKVGDASMISNIIMFTLQIILLGRAFKKTQYLQVFLIFLFGFVVNFFFYNVLQFEVYDYIFKIILLFLGAAFVAIAVTMLVVINILTMPLEGFCTAFSARTGIPFAKVRLSMDVITIILCLALSFIFSLPMEVREGTIIVMIVFNGLVAKLMNPIRNILGKN